MLRSLQDTVPYAFESVQLFLQRFVLRPRVRRTLLPECLLPATDNRFAQKYSQRTFHTAQHLLRIPLHLRKFFILALLMLLWGRDVTSLPHVAYLLICTKFSVDIVAMRKAYSLNPSGSICVTITACVAAIASCHCSVPGGQATYRSAPSGCSGRLCQMFDIANGSGALTVARS